MVVRACNIGLLCREARQEDQEFKPIPGKDSGKTYLKNEQTKTKGLEGQLTWQYRYMNGA
jgi:hypothetical protein